MTRKGQAMPIIIAGGAGGDGKTTVLELVSKYLVTQGHEPLNIDANPDQNQGRYFGVPEAALAAMPKLFEHWEALRDHLEGGNPDYPDKQLVVDTSPLTENSGRWDASDPQDHVLKTYSIAHDGMRFMRTGTYEAEDIGAGCLHDKIGTLTFMLNHMYDGIHGENRVTLVDNAHGRDAFGTALYAQGDMILVVATPDAKSIDIMSDYLKMAEQVEKDIGHKVNVGVIGNRFSANPSLFAAQEKIFRHLTKDRFIAALAHDDALDRGLTGQLGKLGAALDRMDGAQIMARLDMNNAGPALDRLSPRNIKSLEMIAAAIHAATRNPHMRKEWIALCLNRSDYLDQTDPAIRQMKTAFVADTAEGQGHYQRLRAPAQGHVHGPHCKH